MYQLDKVKEISIIVPGSGKKQKLGHEFNFQKAKVRRISRIQKALSEVLSESNVIRIIKSTIKGQTLITRISRIQKAFSEVLSESVVIRIIKEHYKRRR